MKDWVEELIDATPELPQERKPRPYWSQRTLADQTRRHASLAATARRLHALVREFGEELFFAQVLGYDCCDGNGDTGTSAEDQLDRRVGKSHLWIGPPEEWAEDDLYDFIEVFHDLAARPTSGWIHSYGGCGWHPHRFAREPGQALYRWRVNGILADSSLGLRLADDGEDVGRLVRAAPGELGHLVEDVLASPGERGDEVAHAIALFRAREGTRHNRRSAIISLARVLEERRALLHEHLWRKDEAALFQIANQFDLRHRKPDERDGYGDEFLEWIFYWYLATVRLTDQLLARENPPHA